MQYLSSSFDSTSFHPTSRCPSANMGAAETRRAYGFEGNDTAYIHFLERQLGQTQKQLESLEYSVRAFTTCPPEPGNFEFVLEHPEITGSQRCKGSRSLPRRWKIELDHFLDSISTQLRSTTRLNDNRAVVGTLLATPASKCIDGGRETDAISLLTCAEKATHYARTTGAMLEDAQSALTSARFRGVVVAAISEVFEAHGPTLGWNDSTLQACFGDVDNLDGQRFRRGAKFACRCMSWLERTPLGHRGSEIIYSSESSIILRRPPI